MPSILFPLKNMFVSSANNIGNNNCDILEISLTYSKNSNGPNIDP